MIEINIFPVVFDVLNIYIIVYDVRFYGKLTVQAVETCKL